MFYLTVLYFFVLLFFFLHFDLNIFILKSFRYINVYLIVLVCLIVFLSFFNDCGVNWKPPGRDFLKKAILSKIDNFELIYAALE